MLSPLTQADAAPAAALSATFGWPHREADWAWFLRLGQGLAWREQGVLQGTAMMFPLDAKHAAIGLVQVSPAQQGRGLGRRLTQAAMDLAAGRSLRLHATAAGAGLYARLGFEPRGLVEQWQGIVGPATAPAHTATAADHAAIAALDQAATGLDRATTLQALLQSGTAALTGPAAAPSGYAIRRPFGRGALIGPIVAPDTATAASLVAALQQPGFLRIDTPAGSGLIEALATPALASVEDVQVMVRGPWPQARSLFALASQALG